MARMVKCYSANAKALGLRRCQGVKLSRGLPCAESRGSCVFGSLQFGVAPWERRAFNWTTREIPFAIVTNPARIEPEKSLFVVSVQGVGGHRTA